MVTASAGAAASVQQRSRGQKYVHHADRPAHTVSFREDVPAKNHVHRQIMM
jgi:hypothetical protein